MDQDLSEVMRDSMEALAGQEEKRVKSDLYSFVKGGVKNGCY